MGRSVASHCVIIPNLSHALSLVRKHQVPWKCVAKVMACHSHGFSAGFSPFSVQMDHLPTIGQVGLREPHLAWVLYPSCSPVMKLCHSNSGLWEGSFL